MVFVFGDFVLNERSGELRLGRDSLKISPKLLDVLLYLVKNWDRWVPRKELTNKFWGVGSHENALRSAIRRIRTILGDNDIEQRIIKNRHGYGYRLAVPVKHCDDDYAIIQVFPTSIYKAAPDSENADHISDSPILEVEDLRDGQVIRDEDLPLTIEGRYSSRGQGYVWIVLGDVYGHFYLQNPPVMFLPEYRWIASNVLPGIGIEMVHFVAMGEHGHVRFQQMVKRHAWGAFEALPEDSTLLRTIRIRRVRGDSC